MQTTQKQPACATSARRVLEARARELADQRAAFLTQLAGRVPSTDEERAAWARLSTERQHVENELERLSVEERIAEHQKRAQDARAAGLFRRAHHYQSEADYLSARLAEVDHG